MYMNQGVGQEALSGAKHTSPACIARPGFFAAPVPPALGGTTRSGGGGGGVVYRTRGLAGAETGQGGVFNRL